MMTSGRSEHDLLLNDLIERYRSEGYEVLKEPGPDAVPFDLGGYSPDLVAKKGGQGLIIEVKPQTGRLSFDSLRSVAGEIKRHEGWRFLLVTGQDVEDATLPGQGEESFSWDQVSEAVQEAEAARTQGAPILAFMRLWVAFERMMRFRARLITLPIDRLVSPRIMIAQLYSHGELSAQQFELATDLIRVRNPVFHGLDVSDLGKDVARLTLLVRELRDEWSGLTGDVTKQ